MRLGLVGTVHDREKHGMAGGARSVNVERSGGAGLECRCLPSTGTISKGVVRQAGKGKSKTGVEGFGKAGMIRTGNACTGEERFCRRGEASRGAMQRE